jgi:hypothetical protein
MSSVGKVIVNSCPTDSTGILGVGQVLERDGRLKTRQGELRIPGMHDSQEAEHIAQPSQTLHPAVAKRQGHEETPRPGARDHQQAQSGKDVKPLTVEPNPVLCGWGNYLRTGNADREFNKMDTFVVLSLRGCSIGGVDNEPRSAHLSPANSFTEWAYIRLQDTVQYPTQATPRRSSLSRVPENGEHGLKGDAMEPGQPG